MNQETPVFENLPVTAEAVVGAIDSLGLERAKEMLVRFVDWRHTQAEREASAMPGDGIASLRANLDAERDIALVYVQTREYREYGIECLTDARDAAAQRPETADLAAELDALIATYGA